MNNRPFRILSAVVILAFIIASCAPAGPTSLGTIKIATQSPLSGSQSNVGVGIKNGAELALSQLSGPLTALGFQVQLAAYDDQADPNTGVANAKNIVADPTILCVVGHYNSSVQIPSSEEYHNAGLANVSPANTNPKVTDRGYLEVNRIVGRDDTQGAVGAQFAQSKGIKSVYILHDKTTYGQGIAQFFQVEAGNKGIKVLGFDGTTELANFGPVLSPALAAKPDAIYLGGMAPQWAVLIKQGREAGYMGMFISDDGFDDPNAAKIAGDALTQGAGTFYSTVAGPASAFPGTAKFILDYKAKYNGDPTPFAAQGYDSMGICLKAIENAAVAAGNKMPTRNAVALAIRALKDYPGITGPINFNGKGDMTEAKFFVIQITSSDPAKWADNTIVTTLTIAPPQ
jgi:branched-chain amino acid transport system substrate-binding protein